MELEQNKCIEDFRKIPIVGDHPNTLHHRTLHIPFISGLDERK